MTDAQKENQQAGEENADQEGNQEIRIATETLDAWAIPSGAPRNLGEDSTKKETSQAGRNYPAVSVSIELDQDSRERLEAIIGRVESARHALTAAGKESCERICDATDCLLEASRMAERQANRLQKMARAAGGVTNQRTRRNDRLGFVRTLLRGLARLRGRG